MSRSCGGHASGSGCTLHSHWLSGEESDIGLCSRAASAGTDQCCGAGSVLGGMAVMVGAWVVILQIHGVVPSIAVARRVQVMMSTRL